ncbi:hypothetical protein PUN28_006095 [Cardiocondyla obscurior]|uniref:Uncharacterized protein n=1 Tax=Cardiocondyla obscurior TaxID=286306 RepID=A0AAW2GCK1_9HYME
MRRRRSVASNLFSGESAETFVSFSSCRRNVSSVRHDVRRQGDAFARRAFHRRNTRTESRSYILVIGRGAIRHAAQASGGRRSRISRVDGGAGDASLPLPAHVFIRGETETGDIAVKEAKMYEQNRSDCRDRCRASAMTSASLYCRSSWSRCRCRPTVIHDR